MQHDKGTLYWNECDPRQARGVLTRNGIDAKLFTVALGRWADEKFNGGPHIYLLDTLTNKAARVTIQGPDEFDVKISSRTAEELFDALDNIEAPYAPQFKILDSIVVMG